jgi:hypothetical protein
MRANAAMERENSFRGTPKLVPGTRNIVRRRQNLAAIAPSFRPISGPGAFAQGLHDSEHSLGNLNSERRQRSDCDSLRLTSRAVTPLGDIPPPPLVSVAESGQFLTCEIGESKKTLAM